MNIAIIEDDAVLADFLTQALQKHGYTCITYPVGKPLLLKLAKEPEAFDLLLMDWELPDISGLDVVRWVRQHLGTALPIIMVTSRNTEADLIEGLHAGADDYLSKPVKLGELNARMHALLRRTSPVQSDSEVLKLAGYEVYPAEQRISHAGQNIELAPKEFELALLLFRNPGRLFSRDVLSTAVWNREIPATSRTLDTHLSNVRRKLGLRPENGVRLTASYALGYRLDTLDEESSVER